MIRSEPPENWQDLAAGYVLGNLSDEEALIWKQLLQDYPELSDQLEDFEDSFDVFADVVPMHQPPNSLLNQIRAAAQTQSETPPVISRSSSHGAAPRSSARLKQMVGIGGAIAAGIIAVLGLKVYSLSTELQSVNAKVQDLEREIQVANAQSQTVRPILNSLQQPGTLVYSLQGSTLANAASGSLVMSNEKDVIIAVKNLPELPEGQVYRLWADLPSATALTYCGQFNSNTQGLIQLVPSSARCGENPRQMIITIDAVTDPITKGGPIVMQGQI